jgi:hypothetical protein
MHPDEFDYQSDSWGRTPHSGLDLVRMLQNISENTRHDSTRSKIEDIFRLDEEEGTKVYLIQLRKCANAFTKSTQSTLKRILMDDTRLSKMRHFPRNRLPDRGWIAYEIVLPPASDLDETMSLDG